MNKIWSWVLRQDNKILAIIACAFALFTAGVSSAPYVTAVSNIPKIKKKQIKQAEKIERVKNRMKSVQNTLNDIRRINRIVACNNTDLSGSARKFINCSEFE